MIGTTYCLISFHNGSKSFKNEEELRLYCAELGLKLPDTKITSYYQINETYAIVTIPPIIEYNLRDVGLQYVSSDDLYELTLNELDLLVYMKDDKILGLFKVYNGINSKRLKEIQIRDIEREYKRVKINGKKVELDNIKELLNKDINNKKEIKNEKIS